MEMRSIFIVHTIELIKREVINCKIGKLDKDFYILVIWKVAFEMPIKSVKIILLICNHGLSSYNCKKAWDLLGNAGNSPPHFQCSLSSAQVLNLLAKFHCHFPGCT